MTQGNSEVNVLTIHTIVIVTPPALIISSAEKFVVVFASEFFVYVLIIYCSTPIGILVIALV